MHLRTRRLAPLLTFALAATAVVAGPVATVDAATPPCKVTNITRSTTYASFQRAVNKATKGDTLQLRGTCAGPIAIGKNLTVVGVKTSATGAPTLTGNDATRVLRIKAGATVTLKTLTIRDGLAQGGGSYPANAGGGILLEGKATLVGVTVRDNVAPNDGAGAGGIEVADDIVPSPTLIIGGASKVFGNEGGFGAAIENYGTLTIKDTARLHHNVAQENGGAIYNSGTLNLKGSARIDHNTASKPGGAVYTTFATTVTGTVVIDFNTGTHGGGIYVGGGTLSLGSEVEVRDNHATEVNGGGGVGYGSGFPAENRIGVQCGVNVHDNTAAPGSSPNDCPADV